MCIYKREIYTWCDGGGGFCTEETLERECPIPKACDTQFNNRYVDDHCRSHPCHNGHDSGSERGDHVDILDEDAAPVLGCNEISLGGLSVLDMAPPEVGFFADAMANLGHDPNIFDTLDFVSPDDTFSAEQPFHDINGVQYVEKLRIFEQPRYPSNAKNDFGMPSVGEISLDDYAWTTAHPTEMELDAVFSNLPNLPASTLPMPVQKQEVASPGVGIDRTVDDDVFGTTIVTGNVSINNKNGDINGMDVDVNGSTSYNYPISNAGVDRNSDVDETAMDVYALSPAFHQLMSALIPIATPESVATETSFTDHNVESPSPRPRLRPRPRPRPHARTGPPVPQTRGIYEPLLEHDIENTLARSPMHTRFHTPEPSVSVSASISASVSALLEESRRIALALRPAATPACESDIDADATSTSYTYSEIGNPDAEDGGPEEEAESGCKDKDKAMAKSRKRRRVRKPLTMIKYGWKKKRREGQ